MHHNVSRGVIGAFLFLVLAGLPAHSQSPQEPPPIFGPIKFISAAELKTKLAKHVPVTVVDVRTPKSYDASNKKIKGAIRIPFSEIDAQRRKVPRDREVILYCDCPNEGSSLRAAQIFVDYGYENVRVLKGGWEAWLKVKGQVEPS